MFKTSKFQIRQRRYQPNLTLTLAVMIIGAYGYWRVRRWRFCILALVGAALTKLG